MTQLDDRKIQDLLAESLSPAPSAIAKSRSAVDDWFRRVAPVIRWTRLSTPIGPLLLAATERGLQRIGFTGNVAAFALELDGRSRLVEDEERLSPYRRQLEQYFAGDLRHFTLPVDLSATTPFQRSVLAAIAEIPAGSVRSYGQVAAAIGKPKAARAVGQALGSNPIPIVLPCHRVVASDGSLGGYAGGLGRKRQLLALEGRG
jgi:methylated-DNA-[protein]-cysteine S-methyltransferase